MNCPRCNAVLAPEATVCPVCNTAVQQGSQQPQPGQIQNGNAQDSAAPVAAPAQPAEGNTAQAVGAQDKVKVSVEAVKGTAIKAVSKADELYNRLPLDDMNKKLGGKIDLKSKKFKICAAALVLILFFLLLLAIFGGGEPHFDLDKFMADSNAEMKRMEKSLSAKEIIDFETAFTGLSAKFGEEYQEDLREGIITPELIEGLSEDEILATFIIDWFDGKTPKQIIERGKKVLTRDEWNEIHAVMASRKSSK